jgi:3-oxoacyl-[acyl-carrier-protein] synthase III
MIAPRLCAPAYELGEYAEPVTEIPELRTAPRLVGNLASAAGGFVTYRWSEAPLVELAAAAVRRCLADSGVRGDAIDLVLLAMAHHAAPAHLENGRGDGRSRLAARAAAYRDLFARLGMRYPVRPRDALVLPSNFARDVMRAYLVDVGFGSDDIAQENVGRIAHCQGSDPLINLADRLRRRNTAEPGRLDEPGSYVLLGAGISHLAAVRLAVRPVPPAEGGST